MAWASILGGIAGGAASLGNSALNQYFVGQNMKAQYSYWKKAQLNQPSLQREGLEKAGYNPMLALSGGSASFTPSVSSYTPDLVSSAKAGSEMGRDISAMYDLAKKQAEADIAKTKAETDTIKQNQFGNIQTLVLSRLAKWLDDPKVREGVGTSAKAFAEKAKPVVQRQLGAIGEFVQGISDRFKENRERFNKERRDEYFRENYKMPSVPRHRPTRSSRKSSKFNRPKGGWYNGRVIYGAPSI